MTYEAPTYRPLSDDEAERIAGLLEQLADALHAKAERNAIISHDPEEPRPLAPGGPAAKRPGSEATGPGSGAAPRLRAA